VGTYRTHIGKTYEAAGLDGEQSARLAALAHRIYVDPRGFELFDDTVETLEHFCSAGWRNVIVSNHVPELNGIVGSLDIGRYFYACFSSANMGFEKPNPEAFKVALSFCGDPRTVWMVGDNAEADVKGANALGIPAVLVHADNKNSVKYHTETLKDVILIIEENS
jgi:putative hydrolase of the HAD superfamily